MQPATAPLVKLWVHTYWRMTQIWPRHYYWCMTKREISNYTWSQKWAKHWHCTSINLLDCHKHACALVIMIWSPCVWTLSSLLPLLLRFSFRPSNPRVCNIIEQLNKKWQPAEAARHKCARPRLRSATAAECMNSTRTNQDVMRLLCLLLAAIYASTQSPLHYRAIWFVDLE